MHRYFFSVFRTVFVNSTSNLWLSSETMFVLAEMKHITRIPPNLFHLKLTDAITSELNRKLANKVVLNVGLCIALFDITKLGHSYIFPGDGASHTEVNFRYIVFRPVVEEILIGKIRSCSREGVHVTLGFFDDILIPVSALQHPSKFDETEQAWVWKYPLEDGDTHDLFMDAGETIRFRVTSETFQETSPVGPPGGERPPVASTSGDDDSASRVPYRLIAGINEPGLGLLTWWENTAGAVQEADEEVEEE